MSEEVKDEKMIQKNEQKPNRDIKGLALVVGVMVVAIVGLSFLYPVISKAIHGDAQERWIAEIEKNSTYDAIEEYTSYLSKVEGDDELIELFVDPTDNENEYMLSIFNYSDFIYSGDISMWDENGKSLDMLEINLGKPGVYTSCFQTHKSEPSEYMLMKSNFYKYDYPDVNFDYEFTYDYDEEMEWYNCELGTNMSLDAIKTIVKRQYALDVICNVAYECFFFYDDSVEYYEYEGDYYCDAFSSKYCVEIDTDVKCIYLYEIVDEKAVLLEEIEMK